MTLRDVGLLVLKKGLEIDVTYDIDRGICSHMDLCEALVYTTVFLGFIES